jgi:hypothetical protein
LSLLIDDEHGVVIACPIEAGVVGDASRSQVNLIPGASWAIVLSDFGTGAAARPGELSVTFVRSYVRDRVPRGAMPPGWLYSGGKTCSLGFFIGVAQLLTAGCGELFRALLAGG